MANIYEESLEYHSKGRKGKIEVIPTKTVGSQKDLSLAYSPGVAGPCRAIAEDDQKVFEYTAKGNLVAVVTNGTAVLGLGNIGPLAAKPVMEGKGILFKKFADIDVFDIELNAKSPEDIIRACQMLEPTFGGINLEDIKSPECFQVEEELRKTLNIPVFHDDQHGTAVISAAAFLNACEVSNKSLDRVRVVVCGGGAAAVACANLYLQLGVKKENLIMTDSKGVIYQGRTEGMNPYKERFAIKTNLRTLEEALDGADAFVGVSVGGIVTEQMVKKMAKNPIIFAMANPEPEILPEKIMEVRSDAIIATGRSDYPNQVNNVLGFPFIFRGALDTQATKINEEMKMAAVRALADLAKQDIPESVSRAYGGEKFQFGRNYLIPKPFDRRALLWVSSAVAKAAIDSGVARKKIDIQEYKDRLEGLLGKTYTVMRGIKKRVRTEHQGNGGCSRVVLPEGEDPRILMAAQFIREEQIAEPILLGNIEKIKKLIIEKELSKALEGVQIIQPSLDARREEYAQKFFEKRQRKGITKEIAMQFMKNSNYFGAMMVEIGEGDALLGGMTTSYPETIRPALQIIGCESGALAMGVYMIITKKQVYWFADTTVNIDPNAEQLAQIAIQTADLAKSFTGADPRVAMLSFSNFGSNDHPFAHKVREAVKLVKLKRADLIIDGEMQADTALVPEISNESFPFNLVKGDANVLVFPNLESGNVAYKLMARIGGAEFIGPILIGLKKPVFVLQRGSEVNDVVNMATIAAMEIHQRHNQKG